MNFLFINDLDIARGCLLCSVEPSMALHVLSLEHFCIMTWDISCNDKGKLLLNFSHTLLSGRSKALKKSNRIKSHALHDSQSGSVGVSALC